MEKEVGGSIFAEKEETCVICYAKAFYELQLSLSFEFLAKKYLSDEIYPIYLPFVKNHCHCRLSWISLYISAFANYVEVLV